MPIIIFIFEIVDVIGDEIRSEINTKFYLSEISSLELGPSLKISQHFI